MNFLQRIKRIEDMIKSILMDGYIIHKLVLEDYPRHVQLEILQICKQHWLQEKRKQDLKDNIVLCRCRNTTGDNICYEEDQC